MTQPSWEENILARKIFLAVFCYLATFLFVCIGLGVWNAHQGILENGDPFPDGANHTSFALTGARVDPQTGRYRLEFPADAYEGNMSILVIQVNSTFSVYKNGELYYQYAARDPYQRIQQIPLSRDFFDPDQQKIVIEYSSGEASTQQKVLLGLETSMENGILLYTTFQLLSLGALSIMLIYAISLFAWKPGERYLSLFIIYTGLQFVWGGLTLLPQYTNSLYSYVIETIINTMSILVSYLTVTINLGLFNIRYPRRMRWLVTWYGAIGCIVFFLIFAIVDYSSTYEFFRYFRLIGGFVLLVYVASKNTKGVWILIIGSAISQGLLFYPMVTDWGFVPESLYFSYFRAAKLAYLPFTFSIMVFINHKFAKKFKESEDLTIELTEINKSLDRIVEQRTNELKRQQAFRHNMMLNVIHDLRSPLFVLKGCTDIIPAESTEVKENLNIMKERIDFLTHLTEDLFLIEQLEDEKVLFASEKVDLYNILLKVCSATNIEAVKKGIVLQTHLQRSCFVWGDQYRLEQALQNLVVNAIYYTPQNGAVSVKTQINNGAVLIFIQDTGKGISDEEIQKVFERYYHSNEINPHQSTGLGLSIAQEIIKQHHGTISIESAIGIGSTFKVELPLLGEH